MMELQMPQPAELTKRRAMRLSRPLRIVSSLALLVAANGVPPTHAAAGPSFDCQAVSEGSTESLICADQNLSALDRKLAEVYSSAIARAHNEHPPVLRAEQRGWLKGRDDCWKAEDETVCVAQAYTARIAELQARYALVESAGPVFYSCDGNPAKEVVATFFRTEPATLIAEFGDQVSLMFQQEDADGTWYRGRNESLRQDGAEAKIVWGYGASEMVCASRRPTARPQ